MNKEQAQNYWNSSFQKLIDEKAAESNTIPSEWRAGGRATKAFPDKENDIWWSKNGPEMVENFMNWWTSSGWQVFVANDLPHIEAGFNVMFGDVPVRGFVDLIVQLPNGEIAVVDYKTGTYMPDSGMQLGLYACCVEMTLGVRPTRGFFYNARNSVMEEVTDIHRWTIPLFTELFKQFERALAAEIFLPSIGMMCKSCSVNKYCYAYGGELAGKYDPLASIDEGKK